MVTRALILLGLALCVAAAQPWDQYNLSPASRTIVPAWIYDQATGQRSPLSFPFSVSSAVVFDFAIEVGGFISFVPDGDQVPVCYSGLYSCRGVSVPNLDLPT